MKINEYIALPILGAAFTGTMTQLGHYKWAQAFIPKDFHDAPRALPTVLSGAVALGARVLYDLPHPLATKKPAGSISKLILSWTVCISIATRIISYTNRVKPINHMAWKIVEGVGCLNLAVHVIYPFIGKSNEKG